MCAYKTNSYIKVNNKDAYSSECPTNHVLLLLCFRNGISRLCNCDEHKHWLLRGRLHKGRVMGPLLVLVFLCLRENITVTCKIVSFLCSLDNLLLKYVIVFFFQNQISKWRSFEKQKLFLTYFSRFLLTREKTQQFLQHISPLHTYAYFAHPFDFFCLTNFAKIMNLSCMVSLLRDSWCWFLFPPYWSNP